MIIRTMQPDDWEQVRNIYIQGIATGIATFETQAPDWDYWDAKHHSFGRFVAEEDDKILGWVAVSPVSQRHCYRGVADIGIYVMKEHRKKGVGTQLLDIGIADTEENGLWTLQAIVMSDNRASIRLHEKSGFRIVGVREKIAQLYGEWKDTFILERRSGSNF
jgi:L-amino acid N-acyltransferase YncA